MKKTGVFKFFPLSTMLTCVLFIQIESQNIDYETYLRMKNQSSTGIPKSQNNIGMSMFTDSRSSILNKGNLSSTVNSIDPNTYFIGGGDRFTISVIGLPSINYEVTINQQGDLYIPELGILKLGKMTLKESQNKIAEYIREKLKKPNEIYVQLINVKEVTVSVNGGVEMPGTYILSGGDRILDAINASNNGKMPSLNNLNFREVICKNKDSIKKFDLLEYLLKNDLSANPYVYPGDNVYLAFATKKVMLNASTKSSITGWIPIKENENLADFLSLQNFDYSVDTTTILFQSMDENANRSIRTISWNDAGSTTLSDKDIITIPSKKNYLTVFTVSISGEISRPGTYPIVRNQTTVKELFDMAGGPTDLANIDRAVVIRDSRSDRDNASSLQANDQKIADIKTIRPEMFAGMQKMAGTGDFSVMEVKTFGSEMKLQEKDQIIVPLKEQYIYISGNVKRPGSYAYVSGESKNYYIGKAGGFNSKASKSNVFGMRYYGSVSQITDLSEIIEGDIIVVPDSQEGKTLSTIIIPILGIVLSTISILLVIIR